jgi:hypothetical protein
MDVSEFVKGESRVCLCENSMKFEKQYTAWHPQLSVELKDLDTYDNSWCSCIMHGLFCIPCGIPLCVFCGVGCCFGHIPALCLNVECNHSCSRATENTVHWMASSPWFCLCHSK